MSALTWQYKPKNKTNKQDHALPKPKLSAVRSPVIQAKLTVGQPNDIYEQEADRLADRVMRMTDESLVQRQSGCPECQEEEGFIQRQSLDDEEEMLQAKSASSQTPQVTPPVESGINSLKGSGHPLPESTRAFFEPRFGTDFSHVRVHTGNTAAQTAQSINAKAYTTGNNIAFNRGQYAPESEPGKRLLAHELTHVVQQKGMTSSSNCIYCDNGEATPPGICGPDITQVIITHLNNVVSQEQGDLSWIWMLGGDELRGYARSNGTKIRNAADSVSGCPIQNDCRGSYTIGGQCISGRHIDHILIMSYIELSYGAIVARSAGQYQESFWLGFFAEGSYFEGSSEAVANADLTFNEIAICLSEHMAHADESDEDITDILTREEIQECFEEADMSVIGNKSSSTGSISYADCTPCSIPAPMPGDLEHPPIDI